MMATRCELAEQGVFLHDDCIDDAKDLTRLSGHNGGGAATITKHGSAA